MTALDLNNFLGLWVNTDAILFYLRSTPTSASRWKATASSSGPTSTATSPTEASRSPTAAARRSVTSSSSGAAGSRTDAGRARTKSSKASTSPSRKGQCKIWSLGLRWWQEWRCFGQQICPCLFVFKMANPGLFPFIFVFSQREFK